METLYKNCDQCGKRFSGSHTHGKARWENRRFCSRDCNKAALTGRRTAPALVKICESCGREYTNRYSDGRVKEPSVWAKSRFCSRQCQHASQRGKVSPNKGNFLSLRQQFERHVDRESSSAGCWLWTAYKNKAGYGTLNVKHRKVFAHRVSYELHNGPIPEGKGFHGTVVRHSCDNPSCVNPEHLFIGTQGDNITDREERGRRASTHGEQHPSNKLSDKNVIGIRRLVSEGWAKDRDWETGVQD